MVSNHRIVGVLFSVLLVALCGALPLPAQTPAIADAARSWSVGDTGTLGADFSTALKSRRNNALGTIYYQEGTYSATGHLLGHDINVCSGKMSAFAWNFLGIPLSGAVSEVTLPGGYRWTAFERMLTTSGQSEHAAYPLIRIWEASRSYGWWVFSIDLSFAGHLNLEAGMSDVRMWMWSGDVSGLAGSMRQGIGVTATASAGFSVSAIVAGGSLTVRAGLTVIGAGFDMPFYLDPVQLTSDLDLAIYQSAWVDLIGTVWFLFWDETAVWHLLPYTAWDIGRFNLLAIRS